MSPQRGRCGDSERKKGGWRRLRGLESFVEDADPIHAARWLRDGSAELPDAVRRAKPQRGGALAICRDVSTSMHGINAKYASSLALRVIELAERRRMRVAVCEYSDDVHALRSSTSGGFFTNDYDALRGFARRLECGGLTDYEAPINLTLDEFANDRRLRSPYVPKHVLFITDGYPTKGDRRCVEARRRMRRAGVKLHTLFVEPDAGATLPTLQVSQLPLPDRAWKRPASQLSHSGWPLVLDRPSAHGRHCHAVALVENFPASHAVHDVAPVRLSVSKPGLHSKQPPSNGTGAYRPISQSTPGIVFKKGKLRVDVIDTRATNA